MHYEFSWSIGERREQKRFGTSCPDMAEAFLRSRGGFPKKNAETIESFQAQYAGTHGLFASVLRDRSFQSSTSEIDMDIDGMTIRASESHYVN